MRTINVLPLLALLMLPVPAEAQASPAYRSSSPITPGTPVPFGDGVAFACSAPGTVRLVMQDGTFLDFYAQVGTAIVDSLAAKDVNAGATTATCSVSVLRRY
ncbi:hypothetical protein ACFZ8E_25105 [Methylobacterium sp. HMF5984]|uniref:hypothetical protein n=1 Tax=Methylobacterium sp. HMF5984 TaxID=3367370 RepID=UPI0038531619